MGTYLLRESPTQLHGLLTDLADLPNGNLRSCARRRRGGDTIGRGYNPRPTECRHSRADPGDGALSRAFTVVVAACGGLMPGDDRRSGSSAEYANGPACNHLQFGERHDLPTHDQREQAI